METHIREVIKVGPSYPAAVAIQFKRFQWTGARILFISSLTFGMITFLGLYVLSPLFSYWFLGSPLQFWRFARMVPRLADYTYRQAYHYLRKDFSPPIPITFPPMRGQDLTLLQINPLWQHGESCADCGKCCSKIKCPFQEEETGQCMAYDSFFWRYFNCGRYPSSQAEIDRYGCPKCLMRPRPG
ncbi:MAG: hypothetical protein MUO52_04790 [Desulfobacterales bacterium]|nr:hypothetical protein [Desulfobacterales bacterium]